MNKELFATGETVEAAFAAGCAQLGVSTDDLHVSYEVVDFPVEEKKFLFFTTKQAEPAKVKITLELPDEKPARKAEKPVHHTEKPARKVEKTEKADKAPKAEKPAAPKKDKPAKKAEKPVRREEEDLEEIAIDLNAEENAKVKAAADYLAEVAGLMGAENTVFTAVKKGEATIIKVDGDKLGVLIGRRGETMESLSYLASLVANRMEGEYLKLGLDVAGYRGKREQDLSALAQRIGEKVARTGRAFAMEPMNPYERRIIHSAISAMEGLRSESRGEGKDRRVVIYSTAENASTAEPETERSHNSRGPRRDNNRGRNNGGRRDNGRGRSNGPRRERGPRPSAVPERTYQTVTADEAAPVAPKRTERVDDFADFGFGKIEL